MIIIIAEITVLVFSFIDVSVNGATGFSPPDTTTEVDKDRKEGDEDEDDVEPNAAELRRRRLRKLETSDTPDHWWRDPFKSWMDFDWQ